MLLGMGGLVDALGYSGSPNWVTDPASRLDASHQLRVAIERLGILGAYHYLTAPEAAGLQSAPKPAVYLAPARDVEEARRLHRAVWNLGSVPFLIVELPGQVRVYSGFTYSHHHRRAGLLASVQAHQLDRVVRRFDAAAIDSGRLWRNEARALRTDARVDARLLANLQELGDQLRHRFGLAPSTAHALIGKYIYIHYLRDRSILSPQWLEGVEVDQREVFGRNAHVAGLGRLVTAIEARFNGNVFPLPLTGSDAPSDEAVRHTASVFSGDDASGQLAMDFLAYDFSLIPIELLSSIYEQFLHAEGRGRSVGAFYTPEPVADFLLSEIEAVRPLVRGTPVLDPACGSGVFLVLAYRRLIEGAIRESPSGRLTPSQLRTLLQEHIFGVERSEDACRVAEFSLLLTLLSYTEPPELHRNHNFRFPDLRGRNIFRADFFDPDSEFVRLERKFGWIVGNPPWKELDPSERGGSEKHAADWIDHHSSTRPVARYRVGDAFLWRALDFLRDGGVCALLTQVTTLMNAHCRPFRQSFFRTNRVHRVTNFASLAYRIFGQGKTAPAALVYEPRKEGPPPNERILHLGPMVGRQPIMRLTKGKGAWCLTIHEEDIQEVRSREASGGSSLPWRMALWGSSRHSRVLRSLLTRMPRSLGSVSDRQGWTLAQGLALQLPGPGRQELDEIAGSEVFHHQEVGQLDAILEIPSHAIRPIGKKRFVRGGRKKGLPLRIAPHLWITPSFAAYSGRDFVILHDAIGLAGGPTDDKALRALSLYLTSSLGRYLLFFASTSWGMDRTRLTLGDVRDVPFPEFDDETLVRLAAVHERLATTGELGTPQLHEVDRAVFSALGIPEWMVIPIEDFVRSELHLVQGKRAPQDLNAPPSAAEAIQYGQTLRAALDAFADRPHEVRIRQGKDLMVVSVRLGTSPDAVPVHHEKWAEGNPELSSLLRRQHGQWTYIQRSLRLFGGEEAVIVKEARRLDWTRSHALDDADDIIAEVLGVSEVD
ncbi:MAG: type I endonuclease-methyltransferase fusion protein [Gemmatimonadota bacterium]